MNIGSLIASIGGDTAPLNASLKEAKMQMDKADKAMSNSMNDFNASIKKASASMISFGKKTSTYLTLPLVAAGGYAIKMASDYEESLNKVDVAFKDSAKGVKDWAKTTLQSFGIAEGTSLDMAALFGDMATSMGFATDAAASMSTQLVGLAGDLASFKNIGIEQATTALNGVFTGETESLKRLGVVMTETNLSAYAMAQGIQKNYQDMSQAEKVMLRYKYIMSVTKNAQGDFARTQGGAANQMRIFQETLKQVSVTFGQVLLPLFTKVLKKVNEWLLKFAELSPVTKKFIVIFAGIAAAIGPVAIALGGVLKLIPLIAAGGKLVMTGWFPVIAVITAVAGAFMLVSKWQRQVRADIDATAQSAANLLPLAELQKRYNDAWFEYLNISRQTGWLEKKRFDLGIRSGAYAEARVQYETLKKAVELATEAKKQQEDFNQDLDVTKVKFGELKTPELNWDMPGMNFKEAEFRTPSEEPPMFMKPQFMQSLQVAKDAFLEVKKVMAEPLPQQTYSDLEQYSNSIYVLTKTMREGFTNNFTKMRTVVLDLGAELENLAETAIVSLAESIGNIMGGGSFKDGMNGFLIAIADWAIQLGKIMVAAGISISSFWKAITVQPWLAVGLGAALIIAGTAVKGAINNNPGGGSSASTSGGSVGNSEGVGLKSQRELLEFEVKVTGEIRAQGSELVTVIDNENKRKGL